ncbi:MAG: hypothetical protein HYT21_02160 [Candidatus Nealsonbacteria bacterium]|nr:hypothetical protein [Candidatus Nealsonbacteria bacterium]
MAMWQLRLISAHRASGNVGIGTASPGAKLDISGTAGTALKISNGGDLVISAQVSGSDTTLYNDTGSLNINTGLAAQGNISATNGYMVGSPTAGAKIQSGYGSGYTSESCDGGSGYHSYTINFPQAFSTIPVVVISARGGGDRSVYVASVQSVSSTRFTFRYSTNDCGRNEGSSGGLYWIAIGQ